MRREERRYQCDTQPRFPAETLALLTASRAVFKHAETSMWSLISCLRTTRNTIIPPSLCFSFFAQDWLQIRHLESAGARKEVYQEKYKMDGMPELARDGCLHWKHKKEWKTPFSFFFNLRECQWRNFPLLYFKQKERHTFFCWQ